MAIPQKYMGLAQASADRLNIPLEDYLTGVSYETGGTFNPMKRGPTTQWGQHRGLIQFGEPQAKKYGVDFSSEDAAWRSQLGAEGAIVKYMLAHGYDPAKHGNMLDFYSTINAGGPGRYTASDANNGGAAGNVADKVRNQMEGHRRNAQRALGSGGGGGGGGSAGLEQTPPTTQQPAASEPEKPLTGVAKWRQDNVEPIRQGVMNKLGLDEDMAKGFGEGLETLGAQLMRGHL
jgi:hypothetical protein